MSLRNIALLVTVSLVGWSWGQDGGGTVPGAPRPKYDRNNPYVIPQKNYRVAPNMNPLTGRLNAQKENRTLNNTRSFTPPARQRANGRGPLQDRDVTNALSDEIHPVYNADFRNFFVASNATGTNAAGRLTGVGGAYHIWRMDNEGGSAVRLTGNVPEEASGDQIEPSVSANAILMAYANRPAAANANYNIIFRTVQPGTRIAITNDLFENRRPTLAPNGNLVAFSSNREGGQFKIFLARTDGFPFDDGTMYRRLSDPPAGFHDMEPAWAPNGDQIAFTRMAGDGSSSIYLMDYPSAFEFRWTNFPQAKDRQPAWSADSGTLLFASTRKATALAQRTTSVGTTFDIWRMSANPLPEDDANNINRPLALTLDPSSPGAEYPTAAIQFNRFAYQSARPNATNTQGAHDIWESLVEDLTPPTLEELPVVTPKESLPGTPITVKARVTDFQSGIRSVYAQFKDPDSAEQDFEGLEHKIYLLASILVDTSITVPTFVEIGQQAIDPVTGEFVDSYAVYPILGFPIPSQDPLPSAIRLFDDGPVSLGGNEPEGEVAGDGWFTTTWITPLTASDFYVDLIVRDNANNFFVYDNIAGFTTLNFAARNKILLIADHSAGQQFVQTRGAPIGASVARPTWIPTESYLTDNPTGKFPFDLATVGNQQLPIFGDGPFPSPRNPLMSMRSDTLGINTTNDDTYDLYRVQCRLPLNAGLLAGYLPRMEPEPIDLVGGTRLKSVVKRMVMFSSPYTGDVWAGPGHLLDVNVQQALRTYMQSGGRLAVTGQDIAWALSLNGGLSNDFLQTVLRMTYDSDTAEDVFLTPYDGLRHRLLAIVPAAGEANFVGQNVGAGCCWIRIVGGTVECDAPADLRLANPGVFQIDDQGNLITFTFAAMQSLPLGPFFMDAAWNQVWIDTVTVNPTDRSQYRYGTPGTTGASDRAGFYYTDAATGARLSAFAFGIEGVHSHYNQMTGGVWNRSYRNKVIHNMVAAYFTSELTGIVQQFDPETNEVKPLPRALVRVTALAPATIAGQIMGYGITDTEGRYLIQGLEAGLYLVDAERVGFRTQHPETISWCDPGLYTMNLMMLKVPPGTIRARVVDINGTPVQGAIATATSLDDAAEPAITSITGPDGVVELNRVPVGDWRVTADAAALGFQPGSTPPFQDAAVTPGAVLTLPQDFVVEPLPGTIDGTVIADATGLPIAGAQLRVLAGTIERGSAVSDANGAFSMVVPAGTYEVTAVAPGFQPGSLGAVLQAGQTVTLTFRLLNLPPGSVIGTVRRKIDNAGEPNVLMELVFAGAVKYAATTNANGQYTFPSVDAADYVIRPSKTGFTFTPMTRNITVNSGAQTNVADFIGEPLRTFPKGLSLVSSPYDYAQDIADLLGVSQGDRGTANFLFYGWDAANGKYIFHPIAPATTFKHGRGYWIQTANNLSLTIEGALANETQDQPIALKQGWNLIGDPFRFAINWSATRVVDPDNGQQITNQQAVAKGLIANSLWGFQSGQYQAAQTQIDPWRGYWIFAYRDLTLIIPPGAQVSSATGRAVPRTASEWRMAIVANTSDYADTILVGAASSATDGFDNVHDLLKPPPVGDEYLYLVMPRNDWGGHSGPYGVDIRNKGRAASWDFMVDTNVTGAEITLRWPEITRAPRTVNPVLVDLETNERRYMRTTGAYTFRASASGGQHRFRIEMAPSSGLLRINNTQITGGRATNSAHTVSYSITRDAQVEVRILSGGKVVRTLENRAGRSAGANQAVWDGRNQSGIALPPGQYTVEIRASTTDGQAARSVAPLVLTR